MISVSLENKEKHTEMKIASQKKIGVHSENNEASLQMQNSMLKSLSSGKLITFTPVAEMAFSLTGDKALVVTCDLYPLPRTASGDVSCRKKSVEDKIGRNWV